MADKKAILRIYSDIGEPSFDFFAGDIPAFSSKDMVNFLDENNEATEIEIHINSRGGDVQEGWAIYDLLKASGKKINTVGEGKIYSIATVIFLAGENREIMPNADGLIHLPHFPEYSLAGRYEADDLVKLAEQLKQDGEKILNLYVEVTKQDKETLKKYMDDETMLSADDMVSLGFATRKAEPVKAVAYYKSNKNQMTNEEVKTLGQKIDGLVENFSRLFGAKNQELTDASGAKFKLEKESGEPAVGDKASPDGVYTMSSGKKITVKDGAVTEVTENTSGGDEMKALQTENEALKAEIATLKTQNRAVKDAEIAFKAKETEAKALVTELTELKNKWIPEGRTSDPGKKSTEKGIDLNKVSENLAKLKEAK